MTDVLDKPTTSPISTRKHGDVLIVLSNNPPVNALSTAVRQGLVDAIAEAEADAAVNAIVIACEGQTFFAGADITEFGKPPQMPWLPEVVDTIENCSKPVVAAIHGTALGGGLEVALGCHYRVADPTAKLGTPEVKLGLLPGAGGTQRLPRVAGVRKALEMCATGNPIGAKEAFDCGLVDRLIEGELIPHAVGYAEEVRDVRPLPKSSERQDKLNECDPAIFDEFLKENARKFRGFDAPEANVRAVKVACEKPYSEGVIEERKLFMELMSRNPGPRAAIFLLRRAQGGEDRRAAREHRTAADKARRRDRRRDHGRRHLDEFPVSAGIPVTIIEMEQAALDRGTGVMRKNYEASAAKGRLTQEQVERCDGSSQPDARFRGARRLRPDHRGRLREHGREEGGVRPARQDRQAGRDPRLQHLLSRHRRDRGEHFAPRRRGRHALLLAGQRDEAAGGRARRQDRARRAADRDAIEQDASGRSRSSRAFATASSATAC